MELNEQQPQSDQSKKSNKALPITIAVVVLLLLGWYFTKGSGNKAMLKSDGEETGKMQTQNNQNSPMSLKELMSGKAQTCEVVYGDEKAQSKGTVFVLNGKVRGDFSTETMGKTEVMHMINDGKTQYIWSDGEHAMAMKISLDAMHSQTTDMSHEQTQKPQSIDENAKYNYNCKSWSGNDSDFLAPTNVNFTDYSEMMKNPQAPKTGTQTEGSAGAKMDVKAMQCAACSSLSGEDQVQCKAALSCK